MRIGKYEILSEIKKGDFVEVYKAFNKDLERVCLLKIITKNFPDDIVVRFKEEAKILSKIDHPNVVKIYEIFEKENKICISLEWVEGYDLGKILEICGKIPPLVASLIIYDVLDILEYVHKRGIIHRDIKPSNILVSNEGFVKLTDFGIAKKEDSPEITKPGTVIGTPFYMSPEQVKGQKLNFSSDLFSLGITFYEILTGKKPFTGEDTTQILIKIEKENPDFSRKTFKRIDRKLKRIIKKALKKEPEKRFKDAKSFKKELLAYLKEKDIINKRTIISEFLKNKIKGLEGVTVKEEIGVKKRFNWKKKFYFALPFLALFSVFFLFHIFRLYFYPYIKINVPFKEGILEINDRIVKIPFEGRIKPGLNKIEMISSDYIYKGFFSFKLKEKREIILPYTPKDSLSLHFRGKGDLYLNHIRIGKDSLDFKLKSSKPYLIEVKKEDKTVFKYFLPASKNTVIWIEMRY